MQSFSYGQHERQKLDFYPARRDPRGVVIFFYGGTWREGSRKIYRFLGSLMSRRGFALVVPDYRLFPEVRFPTFMEDAALAVRWTRDNVAQFGVDPQRMILMGHSAGAHMAALLLTNRTFLEDKGVPHASFKGFIGLSGPYSFDPLKYQSTAEIFRTADPIDIARPIKNVSGAEPPMLLLHGQDDRTVYPINTLNLTRAVDEAGGRARCIIYPRLGHKGTLLSLMGPLRWRAPVLRNIEGFLGNEIA